ncbi:MAG: DUF2244 domain-containing protein [Beijerinckiaceae bacterium]
MSEPDIHTEAQEDLEAQEDPAERRIFATRLVPHRSLTRRNFYILMMAFAAASFVSTLPFVVVGAWPIAGFMGLDVALFYLAFRANFRAARAYEDVNLTPLELQIAKVSAKGVKTEWRFHPSWVRLHKEEHEEYGLQKLALVSRGQSVEIAHFLGPDEKARFATRLTEALAEARRGPRFS